jgi:hypothetical protein
MGKDGAGVPSDIAEFGDYLLDRSLVSTKDKFFILAPYNEAL